MLLFSQIYHFTSFSKQTIGRIEYRWPHDAEDLDYDAATGYLWCLTEYETEKYGQDNRCVFAVRLT
jgi:hypothetical protein